MRAWLPVLRRPPNVLMGAALIGVLSAVPSRVDGQDERHCRLAHEFLEVNRDMIAVTEPDTLDDWRTRAMVPGCRVTAAGITERTLAAEARLFFELLRGAGWVRTPDPRDAPNEASLRFRRDGSDCLFNFYSGGLLGTETEAEVDDQAVPGAGERRYNFLVLCMTAREAAPRGPGREATSVELPAAERSLRSPTRGHESR